MKTFKKIAMATLAASVASVAVSSAQADGFGWGKGQQAGWSQGDKGHGFGHGKKGGRKAAKRLFERFDLDQDGVITAAEIEQAEARNFGEADADGSGNIDLAEFKEGFAQRTSPMQVRAFQRLDRDGDGSVTSAEFDALSDRMFTRLDRDGNGELERVQMRPRHGDGPRADGSRGEPKRDGTGPNAEKPGRQADGSGKRKGPDAGPRHGRERAGHMGPHGGRMGGHMGGMMEGLFTQFDSDGDGKVTRAEFEDVRGKLFASADTDSSGSFSLSDFSTIWMTLNDGRAVRMFQKLDADGDLSITAEEHASHSSGMLERMDRNGDGVITKADFKRFGKGKWGKGRGQHDGERHGYRAGGDGKRGERS